MIRNNKIITTAQDYEPITDSAMPRKPVDKLTPEILVGIIKRNRAAYASNMHKIYHRHKFLYDMF